MQAKILCYPTPLHHIIFLSSQVQTPLPTTLHTLTNRHTHTHTLGHSSHSKRKEMGSNGHLPSEGGAGLLPPVPGHRGDKWSPLSHGMEGTNAVLGFGLEDLTFWSHTPREQLSPRGPSFSGLTNSETFQKAPGQRPQILKIGESQVNPRGGMLCGGGRSLGLV